MSMNKNIKSIRDPVHGFVYITPAEQLIVDRPEFQRLRFVLQQSTAYLSYPTNTTNRFAHSLGACHVAGQALIASLSNCADGVLLAFLQDSELIIKRAFKPLLEQLSNEDLANGCLELIGNPFAVHSNPPFSALPTRLDRLLHASPPKQLKLTYSPSVTISILWEAIRFATLVHDLGHLPMSHLFELAITESDQESELRFGRLARTLQHQLHKDFQAAFSDGTFVPNELLNTEVAVHEQLGCMLFNSMYPRTHGPLKETSLLAIVAWLAKCIVAIVPSDPAIPTPKEHSPWRVLRFLHLLIAGEIDADRIDYSIRDPRACSVEFGSFSQDKIIRSMSLVLHRGEYLLAIDRRAQVDVEMFFIQRYYALRTVVFDHNVQRSEAILRHIIRDLFEVCRFHADGDESTKTIRKVCLDYGFWIEGDAVNQGALGPLVPKSELIGRFDDSWLRAFLYSIWKFLDDASKSSDDSGLSSTSVRLRTFIDIILHRRVDLCLTLNKFDADSVELSLATQNEAMSVAEPDDAHPEEHVIASVDDLFRIEIFRSELEAALATCVDQFLLDHAIGTPGDIHVIVDYERLRMPKLVDLSNILILNEEKAAGISLMSCSHILRCLSESINVDLDQDISRGKRNSEVLRGEFSTRCMRIFLVGPAVRALRMKDANEEARLRRALWIHISKGLASHAMTVA